MHDRLIALRQPPSHVPHALETRVFHALSKSVPDMEQQASREDLLWSSDGNVRRT